MRATITRAFGLALLVLAISNADAASIGGPFSLVDQHGEERTDEDFRGRSMLLYFGFTHCPDICPTSLLKITSAIEEVEAEMQAKADEVTPVFITVDPERDTPEMLRNYAEHFHPRLAALTGEPEELADIGRRYGVFFAKVPTGEPGDYLVDHTSFIYLMGPDGAYVEHFERDVEVEEIVGALRRHLLAVQTAGG